MSIKLDKLGADRDRALRKRDEWDAKYKELDRLYKERENTEIHDIVHAANLTPDQLAQLLQSLGHGLPAGEIPEEITKPTTENTNTTSMEEIEDEAYRELSSLEQDLGISAKTMYAVSNNLGKH